MGVENFMIFIYVKSSLSGEKISFKNYQLYKVRFYCLFVNLLLSGSPNVTSLRYDNQSRTLTCNSTGGPATTVTWRRDWVVITLNATHKQTKRVVDPVAGTYETVLTISQSVDQSDIPGFYSCAVENARGSDSEAVVIPGRGELIS